MDASILLILLIKISIMTLMVSLGLGLQLDALTLFRHRPWLIGRVLIGSCVLVPLVALVLLKLPISQYMSPGARFGIALMALSPSAPLTLRKARIQGGDHHLAALLQVAAAVVAIISIPVLCDGFRAVYGVGGWDIGAKAVASQVASVQVLPLSIGLMLRRLFPKLEPWATAIQKIASTTMMVAVLLILSRVLPELLGFITGNWIALLAMIVMTMAALAIGYGLGGKDPQERMTTALVTSMRNPGLALLFALTHGKGMAGVKLAIISYLLMTILASLPFLRWLRLQGSISPTLTYGQFRR